MAKLSESRPDCSTTVSIVKGFFQKEWDLANGDVDTGWLLIKPRALCSQVSWSRRPGRTSLPPTRTRGRQGSHDQHEND